jgi:2-polyprenyl-6-methoxyphenol hydroxylase-like FAD-dependent oxidoreductase
VTRSTYDAIVIGARCAGAPTAMLLARTGARVLLVDRASFPSDTLSGHAIKPPGVAYLQRWGLLDEVLATGCPPVCARQVTICDQVLPAPPPDPDSLPLLAPRRTVLDMLLVQAAGRAGVHVHEQTTLVRVMRDGVHVIGVEGTGKHGDPVRATAPIVIGADGKQSWLARQVGAAYTHYQPTVSLAYFAYWSGMSTDSLALYFTSGQATGMFPTNDGQIVVFVQARIGRRAEFQADVAGQYVAALRRVPAVAEALAGATRASPILGMLDMPAYFRQSHGPGWALVGDAAHHKDPLGARGITDAFRDADMVARLISKGLGSETDLSSALAECQAVRQATAQSVSALNHRLAELPDDAFEIAKRFGELVRAEADADAQLADETRRPLTPHTAD